MRDRDGRKGREGNRREGNGGVDPRGGDRTRSGGLDARHTKRAGRRRKAGGGGGKRAIRRSRESGGIGLR